MNSGLRIARRRSVLSYSRMFSVTILGSFIGFVYGFVLGYAIGRIIGMVYNKLVTPPTRNT